MPNFERDINEPTMCSGPKKSITLPLNLQPQIGVKVEGTKIAVSCEFLIEGPNRIPFCSVYRQRLPEIVSLKADDILISHQQDNKRDSNRKIKQLTAEIKELMSDGIGSNVPCKYFGKNPLA